MNWDVLGKATGWLPGATGGVVIGFVVAWMWWDGYASGGCGTLSGIDCVQTPFGDMYSPTALAAMCVAIGGIIGAVVELGGRAMTARSDPPA